MRKLKKCLFRNLPPKFKIRMTSNFLKKRLLYLSNTRPRPKQLKRSKNLLKNQNRHLHNLKMLFKLSLLCKRKRHLNNKKATLMRLRRLMSRKRRTKLLKKKSNLL